jgi:hypothetical protein
LDGEGLHVSCLLDKLNVTLEHAWEGDKAEKGSDDGRKAHISTALQGVYPAGTLHGIIMLTNKGLKYRNWPFMGGDVSLQYKHIFFTLRLKQGGRQEPLSPMARSRASML